MKTGLVAGALALVSVGVARAQEPGAADLGRAHLQARYQIGTMERVLEQAVQLGAVRVRKEIQVAAPDAPDMLFITGAARARGFRLEGYGIFFDVDVPALRRSLTWTLRILERGDRGLAPELAVLKRLVPSVDDPVARRDLQQTIARIEAQVGAAPPGGSNVRTVSGGSGGAAGMSAREPDRPTVLDDPDAVYTKQVKDALVDAMIEYGSPLPLAPDEWLTVAARDQDVSRFQPGEPYDVSTILVRIKGADLAALRVGQISRDEALRRVDLKEY